MNESVAGLSIDAPVKFNGVNVGTVKSIDLDPRDPQHVMIKIAVDTRAPVNINTTATLMSQGLTGISYVNLSGGTRNSPRLHSRNGVLPIIPASPSLMLRLDATVSELTESLEQISRDVHSFLSPDNQLAFSSILLNLSKTTTTLANHEQQLSESLQTLPVLINNLQNASASMTNTFTNLNTQILPQVDTSMSSLQGLFPNLTALSQDLVNNPSMLVRGQAPVPLGPGEKE